jgi:hypothetical protein
MMTPRPDLKLTGALLFLAMLLIGFALVEGTSSAVILIHDLLFYTKSLHSRVHVQHDAQLGWVNIPQYTNPDMYGPGIHYTSNSRSMRSQREFEPRAPTGTLRIVCSGDSFTFGVGVANDQTWCALLSALEPRFETINLGEVGYGIDQTYLKYRRYADDLEHHIHIFAFVDVDFLRMESTTFLGYDKPVLTLQAGRLVTKNIPVPQPYPVMPWLVYNQGIFHRLRLCQFATRMLRKITPETESTPMPASAQAQATARAIVTSLRQTHAAQNRIFILVYLAQVLEGGTHSPAHHHRWRQFVRRELTTADVILVDLVEALPSVPYGQAVDMFHPTWGHYSVAGHAYIARALYERLLTVPEVAGKLKMLDGSIRQSPPL